MNNKILAIKKLKNMRKEISDWRQLILSNSRKIQEEKKTIEKYGTIFNPANLKNLTKEDFKSFLLIKNNRHWEGIHRQGNIITSDMDRLKKGLEVLLDESKDIKERLDFLFPPKGQNYIKGLGRAIVTPILLVVYPDKYGVYNSKSEKGLEKMKFLPNFKGKSFAKKYIEINRILNELALEYKLTLWQLDEFVGSIVLGGGGVTEIKGQAIVDEVDGEQLESYEDFGLESHLEDFLVENWEGLELGKKYSILEEDGDMVGQQYPTPIGIIDILAQSKDGKEWLVVELKKGRSGDQVVGQLLRYIGWIRKEKAKEKEEVKGLIIVGEITDKLKYALETVDNVDLMVYSVNFKLRREDEL